MLPVATPASAAASAAASPATAAAVTATSTATTTASAASPATSAALTRRPRFVHHHRPAHEVLAVQRCDGFLRFTIVGDFDEAEATRLPGEAIANQRHRFSLHARLGKLRCKVLFTRLERQVATIKFFHRQLLGLFPQRIVLRRLKRKDRSRGQSATAWLLEVKPTLQRLARILRFPAWGVN